MGQKGNHIVGSAVAVLLAASLAWAISDGGATAGGVAVVFWCVGLAFVVNWVGFLHSVIARTERFYDLTGTLTYLLVVATALVLTGRYDPLSWLLVALVALWTLRLGTFLFRRISAAGSDSRFEKILTRPTQLFMTWTLQGLWVSATLAAALVALTVAEEPDVGWWWLPGGAIWLLGFTLEAVADAQKSAFRADPSNDGMYISTGLWAWSRHPNYFGEITLWVGVAVVSFPAMVGWGYVGLVSPVFVFALIRYVSGVPMLEAKAEKRWGDDPRWRAYRSGTPLLVPRPPRRSGGDQVQERQ